MWECLLEIGTQFFGRPQEFRPPWDRWRLEVDGTALHPLDVHRNVHPPVLLHDAGECGPKIATFDRSSRSLSQWFKGKARDSHPGPPTF
jgi:hypothetical protein